MRIAFLPDGTTPNAIYRSIGPMRELERRGHEARMLEPANRGTWAQALRWCDVFHVHRVCDGGVVEMARAAKAGGAAFVWDDDDDVTRVDRRVASGSAPRGASAAKRLAARARLFELVDLVTTPSPRLAEVFREAGAPAVRVIENYVVEELMRERGARGGELTIGWVAGGEHLLDAERLRIADVLGRLLDAHRDVHVATLGLDLELLGLRSERYRRIAPVPVSELSRWVSTFDVGLAPLSGDVAINHMRSSIKVKEYAALGVPWLASPTGPYAGLGERQGGRLVADGEWLGALNALVGSARARRRLAKRASRWGRAQLLARNAGEWERALGEAAGGPVAG
ncbi:MAG TPA: hypothetical protein VFU94_13510 [Conexibacter sp.]|nr:hypothetical protein [Conexibacter sp.]